MSHWYFHSNTTRDCSLIHTGVYMYWYSFKLWWTIIVVQVWMCIAVRYIQCDSVVMYTSTLITIAAKKEKEVAQGEQAWVIGWKLLLSFAAIATQCHAGPRCVCNEVSRLLSHLLTCTTKIKSLWVDGRMYSVISSMCIILAQIRTCIEILKVGDAGQAYYIIPVSVVTCIIAKLGESDYMRLIVTHHL